MDILESKEDNQTLMTGDIPLDITELDLSYIYLYNSIDLEQLTYLTVNRYYADSTYTTAKISNLTNINVPNATLHISNTSTLLAKKLASPVTINAKYLSLGDYAFASLKNQDDIVFYNNTMPIITSLGIGSFKGNKWIKDVILADTITIIPQEAFYDSFIRTISLGSNGITIQSNAFYSSPLGTIIVRGNSSCTTAQNLQAMNSSVYNNATIVYTEE